VFPPLAIAKLQNSDWSDEPSEVEGSEPNTSASKQRATSGPSWADDDKKQQSPSKTTIAEHESRVSHAPSKEVSVVQMFRKRKEPYIDSVQSIRELHKRNFLRGRNQAETEKKVPFVMSRYFKASNALLFHVFFLFVVMAYLTSAVVTIDICGVYSGT